MSVTKVPGIACVKMTVTDTCRQNRGELMALQEVFLELARQYEASCGGWKKGMGANMHFVMTVERPETGPP